MRLISPIIAALTVTALGVAPATAQEAAQELTLTGCLAEETDDETVDYVLNHIQGDAVDADEVDLVPGEDVDLAPHVGHTVEVVGVVITEEHDDEMDEQEEGEENDAGEKTIRVTGLSHIAASCEEGSAR